MSESRGFPAELLSFLLFGVFGVAVTAAALAGFAQLMAGQGCSGSVVPILATTAVCMGSLLCALAAAFRKKARGLLTGLLQSTFLAVPLALSAVWNGTAAEPAVVCRLLAVLLCGCICGSMNRQNQKKTFLCCRRRSAYRCKQQSLPFRLYRHRQLNRQSNCRQKTPAFRQSDTPPGIAGCWLRRFCWGVRQPVCYRPYAMPGRQSCCGIIWKRGKGCLHRAVCRGLYSFSAWNI